jgi:hypothetical protein
VQRAAATGLRVKRLIVTLLQFLEDDTLTSTGIQLACIISGLRYNSLMVNSPERKAPREPRSFTEFSCHIKFSASGYCSFSRVERNAKGETRNGNSVAKG